MRSFKNTDLSIFVIIPIYDEDLQTILFPLASLIKQTSDYKNFEVVCVVNNSRAEARKETRAYLQNQKTIIFLQCLKNQEK